MTRAVLVTGAAGGIGAAIVRKLEADGWSVHGVDVADADLATREGNRAVVEAALERLGRRTLAQLRDPAGSDICRAR